jgi:hypothetical protein
VETGWELGGGWVGTRRRWVGAGWELGGDGAETGWELGGGWVGTRRRRGGDGVGTRMGLGGN